MSRKKLVNKISLKKHEGKCHFCSVDDYALLDVHRIVPGEDGGEYTDHNTVVCCANCHRKIHDGQIKIDRKYRSSSGQWILHFYESDEEKWKQDLNTFTMSVSFKQWFRLQEISLGSSGRDNQVTQTSQATAKVAQSWLGQDANADTQAQLVTGSRNRSTLANKLLDAGADAVDVAPNSLANQTTSADVASFLQQQFKLPNVLPAFKPSFMRKRMKKK